MELQAIFIMNCFKTGVADPGMREVVRKNQPAGCRLGCLFAWMLWAGCGMGAVQAAITHVIVISVDGMGSKYVEPLLASGQPNELTTFKRFQKEGAGTLNARNDPNAAVTLPNHVCMITGRGVAGPAGHRWNSNNDPAPDATLATQNGSYVAGVFDVAHDHGLRTGLWSGKTKFLLFAQSYGSKNGAADLSGPDQGRNKIDSVRIVAGIRARDLTTDLIREMSATPLQFVFVHYQDPDAEGHTTGWSAEPASAYAKTLKAVDTEIGRIQEWVQSQPGFKNQTAIILTADHGGHRLKHGDTANPLDFIIPFYVWGPDVVAGGDLYAMNAGRRAAPAATEHPGDTGIQPIRNGESANLGLSLLGLPAVSGSTLNGAQDLVVTRNAVPKVTPPGRS